MRPEELTLATLDVRGGRSLEEGADEIRARSIGSTLIEWWLRGGPHCYIRLWDQHRISHQVIDLREELHRLLQVGRRSVAAGILSVSNGFAFAGSHPNRESVIGRDLIDWFQHGHHLSRQGLDMRVQVNQAVARMEAADG